MRRRLWYYFVKYYMRTGFAFYFKSVRLQGEENIPDKKAVIFVANHQNALLDPLLIGATNKRIQHFLTQAQVFKNPIVSSILLYINMLPVYRMRDGYDTISKNEETFQECYRILNDNQTVLIFAEGSHSLNRRIRALSKGFTRIAFGALEKNPNNEIDIIPVGYNYSDASEYGSSVSVHYGKPISVNHYRDKYDKIESVTQLINAVSKQLKKLTTHIEDKKNYEEIVQHFHANDFLDPEKVNKTLENLDALPPVPSKGKRSFNPLLLLVKINSVFPLLIWRKAYPKIKEVEYISTFRFTVGITAFPIFYCFQTLIVSFFFGGKIGLIYLILSILTVFLLTKTKM